MRLSLSELDYRTCGVISAGIPISSRSLPAMLVRTVTARVMSRQERGRVAARSIFEPPELCTVSMLTFSAADSFTAEATASGMS